MNNLMDGITVLSQSEIIEAGDITKLFVVLVVASFIFIMLIVLCGLNTTYWEETFIVSIIVFLLLFLMAMISLFFCSKSTGEYEYKVIIDESVYMTEFLEQYEIIEQDGLIYTIREKEE